MDHEFLNAYIQRMVALNADLTNKNVMLETRLVLLEKKYNELLAQHSPQEETKAPSEDEKSSDDFKTED